MNELQMECPRGCKPNQKTTRFCLVCSNTGWADVEKVKAIKPPEATNEIRAIYYQQTLSINDDIFKDLL